MAKQTKPLTAAEERHRRAPQLNDKLRRNVLGIVYKFYQRDINYDQVTEQFAKLLRDVDAAKTERLFHEVQDFLAHMAVRATTIAQEHLPRAFNVVRTERGTKQ